MKRMFGLSLAFSLASSLASPLAFADDFPAKPITFVVPFAAGQLARAGR